MSSTGWIMASIINTAAVVAGPMLTPWLNQYVVGSGIIAWYFLGTAVLCFVGMMILSSSIQTPEPWVLLAGALFGAGIVSVQKATERSPEPAIAIAIPASRAFLTALIAFLVLGITSSPLVTSAYGVQAILCGVLVVIANYFNPRREPVHWSVYAVVAATFLSLSDVILKQSGSYDTIFGDSLWFSLAGSAVPLILNAKKTGSIFPTLRDKGTILPQHWIPVLGVMILVFFIRITTQVLSVSMAPNPAYPRLIGSLAVPIVAFLAWNTGRYRVTLQESVVLGLITISSIASGYATTIGRIS